jgi:hypothetical protein
MQRPVRIEGVPQAVRRPLKIFASDPLLGRTFGNRAQIEIANERVTAGPVGRRVEVIDFDGARDCFYRPVDLNDAAILMQNGLDPSESDPRFHQQMVYAVTMRTIENFDRALGHSMRLAGVGRRASAYARLRLFPHAFYGANAFYSRDLNAVLYGYFLADAENPGPNLPGQTVFTCLSHDVIVHETTHALVDRLRPLFLEPSNQDVLAFHEGFADLIALFQHFSYPDVLRQHIQQTRSDIHSPTPLVELARQFGYATGSGKALRSALDAPGAQLSDALLEPHDRGAVLVAAVFGGFYQSYRTRIYDLIRIATGGSGQLPAGDLHPDLVNRIAVEASRTAQRVLDMCIRAFDYLPPVDVTFGDFLRALVTADYELVPADPDLRDAMIEAFRMRAIYPGGVTSLAEESLLWPAPPEGLPAIGAEVVTLLQDLFFQAIQSFDTTGWQSPTDFTLPAKSPERRRPLADDEGEEFHVDLNTELATQLARYAKDNAAALGLDPGVATQVRGFHPVFRVAPNGRLLIELVAQFAQQDRSSRKDLGGVPFRGGATVIASADGTVRYLITKPFHRGAAGPAGELARARLERQRGFVASADMTNPKTPYMSQEEHAVRIAALASFASLHGG